MNLQKIIIYAVLLLDIIGIAVIIPAFPELKSYYGISDFQVTLGLTIYSLFAFLSAPVLGQLSDKIGRKKPLVWCVIGTTISYFILLITQQYWLFLISRVINGVTGGNISILQAILTDISPTPEEKKKNFGLMGALFGMGFIIGPVIGSLLLKYSNVEGIFRFGGVFAIIEVLLLIFHFRNTNHPQPEKHMSFNSFGIIYKFLKHRTMRDYIISFAFIGIGGFIINVGQSLYMNNLFGTTGEQYGYILGALGLMNGVNMGLLVPKFRTKNFSNKFLIVMGHIALIIGYLATGTINQLIPFLLTFFVTIFLSGANMPVYNTEIMSKANRDEIGEVSGMMGGLQSLMMFVGPLIGGILLASKLNIFFGAAAFIACSLAVIVRVIIKEKSIDSKD